VSDRIVKPLICSEIESYSKIQNTMWVTQWLFPNYFDITFALQYVMRRPSNISKKTNDIALS